MTSWHDPVQITTIVHTAPNQCLKFMEKGSVIFFLLLREEQRVGQVFRFFKHYIKNQILLLSCFFSFAKLSITFSYRYMFCQRGFVHFFVIRFWAMWSQSHRDKLSIKAASKVDLPYLTTICGFSFSRSALIAFIS